MKKYIGWVILGTLIFYLTGLVVHSLLPVQVFLAWVVPFSTWSSLGKNTRRQAFVLLLTGVVALLFSASHGILLSPREIMAINLPLLAMFVAISFLTLTNPGIEDPLLPRGRKAVITTAFGTHLLGAVINLSVLFVFGDRLQKKGRLSSVQLIILARSFCAAAWWSPFFIATGVAITYAPGMLWQETLLPGALMSVIAVSYSILEVCFIRKKEFRGYPLRADSLKVPLFLAAVVIFVHHFRPDLSILVLICLLAPAGSFVFMKGRPRKATLQEFIDNSLVSVNSQFALFLAAGVFSGGIKSITLVYPSFFHLGGTVFTPWMFGATSAVMIIIGIFGVHPIISIAIVSPLLLPLNPDPSQLGFLFLTCWALSTGSSPLSGIGLALVSRYQASPRAIIQNNYFYAIVMWALAATVNFFFFY